MESAAPTNSNHFRRKYHNFQFFIFNFQFGRLPDKLKLVKQAERELATSRAGPMVCRSPAHQRTHCRRAHARQTEIRTLFTKSSDFVFKSATRYSKRGGTIKSRRAADAVSRCPTHVDPLFYLSSFSKPKGIPAGAIRRGFPISGRK